MIYYRHSSYQQSQELWQQIKSNPFDFSAQMDISLNPKAVIFEWYGPAKKELEAFKQIKQQFPKTSFICLFPQDIPTEVPGQVLMEGASDFYKVTGDSVHDSEEIVKVLEKICQLKNTFALFPWEGNSADSTEDVLQFKLSEFIQLFPTDSLPFKCWVLTPHTQSLVVIKQANQNLSQIQIQHLQFAGMNHIYVKKIDFEALADLTASKSKKAA